MVSHAWKETTLTIIQNCFCKAGFKHHHVDPDPVPEEPPVVPARDVLNKVYRWMGDVQFNDFVASEPEAPTKQPMTDEEILSIQGMMHKKRNLRMRGRKLHLPN